MDSTNTPSLDPKLKEAYDRVMGIQTPPSVQSTPPVGNNEQTTPPASMLSDMPSTPPATQALDSVTPVTPVADNAMPSMLVDPMNSMQSAISTTDMSTPTSLPPMPPLNEAITQTPHEEEHHDSDMNQSAPIHNEISSSASVFPSSEPSPIPDGTTTPLPSDPTSVSEPEVPESAVLPEQSESLSQSIDQISASMPQTLGEPMTDTPLAATQPSQTPIGIDATPTPAMAEPSVAKEIFSPASTVPPQENPEAMISSSYLPHEETDATSPDNSPVPPPIAPILPIPLQSVEAVSSFATPSYSAPVSPVSPVTPVAPSFASPMTSLPQASAPVVPTQPIGSSAPQKGSSMQKKVLIIGATIIFMLAYALIWIKVLGLPLPFLSK